MFFNILKKSEDSLRVGKNFFYLSILQFGGYLFPLITYPYLAKVIGVLGFGKIAFAAAITGYVQTITDWGFNFSATRDIAKCRENLHEVESIFSTVTWARILLMFVCLCLLGICILTIPYLRENSTVIIISFLLIPGHILFPEWLFQGMEDMKYITYLNLLSKVLFTSLIFIVIKTPDDYIYQPLLLAIGTAIAGITALYFIWKKWKITLHLVSWNQITKTIKGSTDIFINTLMPNFYNAFSIILLGFFGGPTSNGYFDGGNKFNNIVTQFQQVLSRAFFPYLTRKIDKHKFFVYLSLGSSIVITLLVYLLAPWLINTFLDNAFDQSISVLRILAISIFFLALTNAYGTNYLIIIKKDLTLRNITITSSVIGFILSIPLVYYLDYIGAALTITITRAILGIMTYITAKKQQIQRI